ncbi:MAG: tRNA (adenosine(37)-N6)-threonylcarbamoyltransferase complex dimerization subunit type 1 TsaB [Thermoanaerobaculia bacterium]|nr:tRNA (adenosine(37)-N6)-threonylcarbamoyltransferase complex dimerization subunit type 1 TsaB [Thermoanaerobaculia bacterium]
MLISFDTSLPVLSVAIIDDGKPLGSLILESAGSRNEKLLPAVDWLLSEVGRSLDDLAAIIVTRGPGSFTGVRIGLATAQGLAFSRGIELVAISTHEAVAPASGSSVVFGDAGRGEVYRTRFADGAPLDLPDLVPRESVEEEAIDVVEVCRLRNVALEAALRVSGSGGPGRQAWSDATPIYVRPSAAEEKLRKSLEGK